MLLRKVPTLLIKRRTRNPESPPLCDLDEACRRVTKRPTNRLCKTSQPPGLTKIWHARCIQARKCINVLPPVRTMIWSREEYLRCRMKLACKTMLQEIKGLEANDIAQLTGCGAKRRVSYLQEVSCRPRIRCILAKKASLALIAQCNASS